MTSITVLDGGFSTQLSYYVGDIIDGDPLWSARFLKTNPDAVVQTHLDFLKAGAELIITNSYQASVPGFMEYLGCDKTAAYNLIKESVKLAVRSRDLYLKANPNAKKPLIAGSVGPYGASLHDGSEYTGNYIDKVKNETVVTWHRPRLQALIEEGVDLLAIETIPALGEAELLLELIKEYPEQKAWLSFQCKDSEHTARGERFSEVVKKCWSLNREQLIAVGCNCVNPNYVSSLVKGVNDGSSEKIPMVAYPNSGEQYSPDEGIFGHFPHPSLYSDIRDLNEMYIWDLDLVKTNKIPLAEDDCTPVAYFKKSRRRPPTTIYFLFGQENGWSGRGRCLNIIDLVNEWLDLGVKYVGGCCRMDATDVVNIRKAVKKWMLEHK